MRYYDPELQRFISEDPIGFASGDFNWYRYVGNSPVNWVDPWGLSGFDPFTGIPRDIIQPIYNWFNNLFGDKPKSLPGTFDKISDGLCEDIPQALRGFSNGLERLNNLDKQRMTPLQQGLYDYLYINTKRSLNETESPINFIDKVDTYNDISKQK